MIEPENSPVPGVPPLVVANEVRGTTTLSRIDTVGPEPRYATDWRTRDLLRPYRETGTHEDYIASLERADQASAAFWTHSIV